MLPSLFRLAAPRSLTWRIVACSGLIAAAHSLIAENCPQPANLPPPQCLVTKDFGLYQPAQGSAPTLENPQRKGYRGDLKVVVFGDSVMWGDGLPPTEKFAGLFAQQLANLTGRNVHLVSYAHSGARLCKIDKADSVMHLGPDGNPYGDLDSQRPTTVEQEGCAAGPQSDAEVVLLDGCINDVGATNIAMPFPFNWTDKNTIAANSAACGPWMSKLLTTALGDFKNATIIDVNYYRVVSKASHPKLKNGTSVSDTVDLTREQQELWTESGQTPPLPPVPLDSEPSDATKAIFQPWYYNSDAFLATTQDCFHSDIDQVDGIPPTVACKPQVPPPIHDKLTNSKPGPATANSRAYLATVDDDKEFAYGARKTHLWRVPLLKANYDDFYYQREPICKQVFTGIDYKKCLVNVTAHPNKTGAVFYSQSLVSIIQAAWAPIRAAKASEHPQR